MVFRPLAGCGLFPSGRCLRHGLSGVSVPLRGVGCFDAYKSNEDRREVSVPLRGVGCFPREAKRTRACGGVSVPLRGVGCFPREAKRTRACGGVSVPLRGVGCFSGACRLSRRRAGFRPLAGCGLFPCIYIRLPDGRGFPSPCGVWVVSRMGVLQMDYTKVSVPLRGVGCFRAAMSEGGVPEVSVPLRGVGCFR